MLHKFRNHIVSPTTNILILGTFHPDLENGADFFYGRSHNFLWNILPACLNYRDLKNGTLEEKLEFMSEFHIDFADIINSLRDIPIEQKDNYRDNFIDSHVDEWKDIIQLINTLHKIEAVYFTRKTLTCLPNIEMEISKIRNHCIGKCIRFCLLETPARFTSQNKVNSWRSAIVDKTTCL